MNCHDARSMKTVTSKRRHSIPPPFASWGQERIVTWLFHYSLLFSTSQELDNRQLTRLSFCGRCLSWFLVFSEDNKKRVIPKCSHSIPPHFTALRQDCKLLTRLSFLIQKLSTSYTSLSCKVMIQTGDNDDKNVLIRKVQWRKSQSTALIHSLRVCPHGTRKGEEATNVKFPSAPTIVTLDVRSHEEAAAPSSPPFFTAPRADDKHDSRFRTLRLFTPALSPRPCSDESLIRPSVCESDN